MDAYTRASRICVVRGPPIVVAPVHKRGREQSDAKALSGGSRAAFVVVPPFAVFGGALFDLISLDRLRGLIKDFSVFEGAHELDVLRMRPHQRTSRSRGFAEK